MTDWPEHPFAKAPYEPRAKPDPQYQGPPLLAPGERGETSGRRGLKLRDVFILLGILLFVSSDFIMLGVLEWHSGEEDSAGDRERAYDVCYPTGDEERERDDLRPDLAWGSATRLRSRVAIVGARFGGGRESWPRDLRDRAVIATLQACFFFQREARRHGVSDLSCEPTLLPLESTRVELPEPVVDERKRVTGNSATIFRGSAHAAVRDVLGEALEDVVRQRRKEGFAEVAFVFMLPNHVDARDFAMSARWQDRDPRRMPEMTFVFAGGVDQGELSYVVAHESLHLFGADDLYMVRGVGAGDEGDVMNERCLSLGPAARVRDTTAWSVGWRAEPSVRTYRLPSERPPEMDEDKPVRIEIIPIESDKPRVNRRRRR